MYRPYKKLRNCNRTKYTNKYSSLFSRRSRIRLLRLTIDFPSTLCNNTRTQSNKTGYVFRTVTLKRVRAVIVAVAKQYVLHILSVCQKPNLPSMQNACAVQYFHLSPVHLYHISPLYFVNSMIFGKKFVLICSTTSVRNISHIKTNSVR
jgi:hypothetical protein